MEGYLLICPVLPSLFKDTHPPAKINDVQEIVQWSLFGDKSDIGNKQCQKGTIDATDNPNCRALYGTGALSLSLRLDSLRLDNFDAVVFLTHNSQGYPMSLKEKAGAFTVFNPNHSSTNAAENIASINRNDQTQQSSNDLH